MKVVVVCARCCVGFGLGWRNLAHSQRRGSHAVGCHDGIKIGRLDFNAGHRENAATYHRVAAGSLS